MKPKVSGLFNKKQGPDSGTGIRKCAVIARQAHFRSASATNAGLFPPSQIRPSIFVVLVNNSLVVIHNSAVRRHLFLAGYAPDLVPPVEVHTVDFARFVRSDFWAT